MDPIGNVELTLGFLRGYRHISFNVANPCASINHTEYIKIFDWVYRCPYLRTGSKMIPDLVHGIIFLVFSINPKLFLSKTVSRSHFGVLI